MGRATIVDGGADGRYTIQIDTGTGTQAQLVAASAQKIALITARLAVAQAAYDAGVVQLDAQRLTVTTAANAYIDATKHPEDQATIAGTLQIWNLAIKAAATIQKQVQPLLLKRDELRFALTEAERDLARWQNLDLTDARPAWCVDLTEDAAGLVETIEIAGESDHILIAPGAPADVPGAGGALTDRQILSPEQAFFNVAILPGWQKYRPTFRRGTITGLDFDNDTADVTLADARSSAQRLDVNQSAALAGVPVTYMECHSAAFEIGDQVVVMFDNYDWAQPRVIGFVTDPRPCRIWRLERVEVFSYGNDYTEWHFSCLDPAFGEQLALEWFDWQSSDPSNVQAVEYKVNGGAWRTPVAADAGGKTEMYVNPADEGDGQKSAGRIFVLSDFVISGDVFGRDRFNVTFVHPLGGPFGTSPFSEGDLIEFRIIRLGVTVLNIALRHSFNGPYLVKTNGGIAADNADPLDYVLTGG